MRIPMGRTRLALARHEAAHVVIAAEFAIKAMVTKIHEEPMDSGSGTGVREKAVTSFRMGSWMKAGPICQAMVLAAGSLAEHLWHGTPEGFISADDHLQLKETGLSDYCMRELGFATKRLLRKRKRRVWKLADRLMRHGYVDLRNGRF